MYGPSSFIISDDTYEHGDEAAAHVSANYCLLGDILCNTLCLCIDMCRDLKLGLDGIVFTLAFPPSLSFFPNAANSCFLTALAEFTRCMALLCTSRRSIIVPTATPLPSPFVV